MNYLFMCRECDDISIRGASAKRCDICGGSLRKLPINLSQIAKAMASKGGSVSSEAKRKAALNREAKKRDNVVEMKKGEKC